MALTALKITKAKPGRYFDEHGLYLQVKDSSAKSWLLRYELNGPRALDGARVCNRFQPSRSPRS